MSVIGGQIKKYRVEKNITQEQLGQLIGVTTQAVSRWERGGTPDAELLPAISEVLGVSIDALFGREEQSVALALANRLSRMTREEAFRYAFDICWAIEVGLMGNVAAIDEFTGKMLDGSVFSNDRTKDYFGRIIDDSGLAFVRMSPGFRHFFLMPEPDGKISGQLAGFDGLRRVFELLADEKTLRIIYYIYSFSDTYVSASLIGKNTGLNTVEVDRRMEKLCANNLAVRSVVSTAEGNINSYIFRRESFVIPLLCFADEVAKKDFRPFMGEYKRTKPLL